MSRSKLKEPNYRLALDKKSGKWMVSWTDPDTGRTRKKSTGESTRHSAERLMPAVVA